MNPEQLRSLIPPYLSGELNADERNEFEAELARNPELRAEVEEMRTLWQGLGLIEQEHPSAAMRARFYQKLNSLTGEAHVPRQSWLSWFNARPALQFGTALALF